MNSDSMNSDSVKLGRRPSAVELGGNEGHVGQILLLRAIESVFDEALGPLTAAEIAATLRAQGFPAGDARQLRYAVSATLRRHPNSYRSQGAGWLRVDPDAPRSAIEQTAAAAVTPRLPR